MTERLGEERASARKVITRMEAGEVERSAREEGNGDADQQRERLGKKR